MAITFLVLGLTIALLMWGRFLVELVAVGSLLALFLFDVISLDVALSGFSNPTVILIGTLFIVGEGLSRTGITAFVGEKLIARAGGNPIRLLVLAMVATGVLSGFISNAGTVAALMPAVVLASWRVRSVPAAFLIPVAFAANAGGLLTLTGTPPNIVVTDALDAAGFRPFNYFEFSLIGIPLLVVAVVYMTLVGRRLLPKSRSATEPLLVEDTMVGFADTYSLRGELYRMRIRASSPLVGSSLRESNLGRRFGVSVLQIDPFHDDPTLFGQPLPSALRDRVGAMQAEPPGLPDPDRVLLHNDVMLVRGAPEQVSEVEVAMHLGMLPVEEAPEELGELLSQEIGIAEVLIAPRSSFAGAVVAEGAVGRSFGVLVLGIRRGDHHVDSTEPLQVGDALLVRGTWKAIGVMAEEVRNFVVVGQPEEIATQVTDLDSRSWLSLGILVVMVALMASGVVPVVIAALLAAVAMLATGCLTSTQAYRAVSWSTVILIGAMIPMATALDATGGAARIADTLVDVFGGFGAVPLLAGIMLITTGFSQVISNTAAAVLMAPVALGAAAGLGVDPHPLMMGLAVAASTAFLTPVGTAPNLMVMSPGGYRFRDYAVVGLPLLALFFIVSLLLIPIIWPL
ncbi:MAG: SLC13 family permease [Acidimicrobiia bacterium]|nr:SLC13 family permease [Acidimicrobiia bacterium]